MTVKRLGFLSFSIKYDEITIITDPLLTESAGIKIPKSEGDVILITDPQFDGKSTELSKKGMDKIVPGKRGEVQFISSPGEYEVGGVMIRRPMGKDYYLIDEGKIRTVYMGQISKAIAPDKLGDLGDVDLLILPIGNADIFPSFEKLEAIIKRVDPTYIIPCGYNESGLDPKYKELKTTEEFVKQFGFTHVSNEKKLVVKSGVEPDSKVVEVVILE